ncbi:NACHT domain-containing protein [Thiobacillus sp.]|uniref:NACHT domain-containing protein n=1 Tax=Thiobacillus sp. TaxID=924 RepID=UPI00286E2AF5|nr:NACHT domain-containing protein [Thiobacillus sp.]
MSEPIPETAIRSYLAEVRRRHGYMRFLGLPYLRDTPDVDISRLYVPPAVSGQLISPDSEPGNWPTTESPLEALEKNRRLILLGDPGSGKSTLTNWLAWRLSAGLSQRLPDWLEGLLPLPFILREVPLRGVQTFDALLDALLGLPVARALAGSREALLVQIRAGKVLFLLDGLDEVRYSERGKLRAAVWDGWRRYPQCYWLLTSRVVGYDEAPFDFDGLRRTMVTRHAGKGASSSAEIVRKMGLSATAVLQSDLFLEPGQDTAATLLADYRSHQLYDLKDKGEFSVVRQVTATGKDEDAQQVVVVRRMAAGTAYVAPFDDDRIRAFAHNWYALRERATEDAGRESAKFLDALGKLPATWRLARTPNLLTMMALIFRVRARLPDGRALLYGDIAQAYLESIDGYRGVSQDEDRYPLAQKKRWLARVAFEMHMQRMQQNHQYEEEEDRDLLVPQVSVRQWIVEAMAESGYGDDPLFADAYLDYVARRSGLLLPRGEGLYAFLHLSFQEYFSAWYLVEQIRHPQWRSRVRPDLDDRVTATRLKSWANDFRWHETLVFVFEILGQEPGWADTLCERLFGADFKFLKANVDQWNNFSRAMLLARLTADPHSGMSKQLREAAVRAICSFAVNFELSGELFAVLMDGEEIRESVWLALTELQPVNLNLDGCTVDWRHLVEATPKLKYLSFGGQEVGDMAPIASLTKLEGLFIRHASDIDLMQLVKLSELHRLALFSVTPTDLTPLTQIASLRELVLVEMPIESLQTLSSMMLEKLTISICTNFNIASVSGFTHLRSLEIFSQSLSDLYALESLGNLKNILFVDCQIDDPAPLANCSYLTTLELRYCRGVDADFVAELQRQRPDIAITFYPIDEPKHRAIRKRNAKPVRGKR